MKLGTLVNNKIKDKREGDKAKDKKPMYLFIVLFAIAVSALVSAAIVYELVGAVKYIRQYAQ